MFLKYNKSSKIGLSFDLELWHEGEWIKKHIPEQTEIIDHLKESVEPILNLLSQTNNRATFFVTNEVLNKYPDLIKKISNLGHEIGSHSTNHTHLKNLTREDFEVKIQNQKLLINQLTGQNIIGFRAPHFSLTNETKWLLPILEKNGFKYDSSIFGYKTPEYGLKNIIRRPYQISFDDVGQEDEESSIIEIPIIPLKIGPVSIPVAGGIYFRLIPLPIFIICLNLLNKQSILPILYFHPHELYNKTPRIKGPMIKTILKYWGINRSFKKFTYLCQHYHFESIENLLP